VTSSIVTLLGAVDNYPYFTMAGIVKAGNMMIGNCQTLSGISTEDNNVMRTYTIGMPVSTVQLAPESPTSIEQPKEKISIYGADKAIQTVATTNIQSIRVFSLTGALIYSNPTVNAREYRVTGILPGIYLVKVVYGENQVQTTKVMVK